LLLWNTKKNLFPLRSRLVVVFLLSSLTRVFFERQKKAFSFFLLPKNKEGKNFHNKIQLQTRDSLFSLKKLYNTIKKVKRMRWENSKMFSNIYKAVEYPSHVKIIENPLNSITEMNFHSPFSLNVSENNFHFSSISYLFIDFTNKCIFNCTFNYLDYNNFNFSHDNCMSCIITQVSYLLYSHPHLVMSRLMSESC
jgi:hypothetical protein